MKNLIVLSMLAFSFSSFAQVFLIGSFDSLDRYMEKVEGQYRSSDIVSDFVTKVESEFGVTCSKYASVHFSSLSNRTSYKTKCSGDVRLKIKIVSNTIELSDGSIQFEVVKEIIKRK
jgi:hypothetical protein